MACFSSLTEHFSNACSDIPDFRAFQGRKEGCQGRKDVKEGRMSRKEVRKEGRKDGRKEHIWSEGSKEVNR
jgi:hypothetical protein